MRNEETAASSIPLHSLLKLLHATKVLGRLEVEVSSGTLTLSLTLAPALALALTLTLALTTILTPTLTR